MRDDPENLSFRWEDYGVNYRIIDNRDPGVHISSLYEGQLIDEIERDREVIEAALELVINRWWEKHSKLVSSPEEKKLDLLDMLLGALGGGERQERRDQVIEAARAWNRCGPDSTPDECDKAEGRLILALDRLEAHYGK